MNRLFQWQNGRHITEELLHPTLNPKHSLFQWKKTDLTIEPVTGETELFQLRSSLWQFVEQPLAHC